MGRYAILLLFVLGSFRGRADRTITVRDAVSLTEFVSTDWFHESQKILPSPDGKSLLVVTRQADFAHDAVCYSILSFAKPSSIPQPPRHRTLMKLCTTSNREAIRQVKWLANSKEILVLGERDVRNPQVYRIEVRTRRITQLTHHDTPVVSFDCDRSGATLVFLAAPKAVHDPRRSPQTVVHITDQRPLELLTGTPGDSDAPRINRQLFIQRGARVRAVVSNDFLTEYLPLVASPDGRYAVLAVYKAQIPAKWLEYQDPNLLPYLQERRPARTPSNVEQYALLDLQARKLLPLIDAPKAWTNTGISWSPNGREVAVSDTFLPLSENESGHRTITYTAILQVRDRTLQEMAEGDRTVDRWTGPHTLLMTSGRSTSETRECWQRSGGSWARSQEEVCAALKHDKWTPSIQEDLNSAPKLIATSNTARSSIVLLDPNPQLQHIHIGQVEYMRWRATDGHEVEGDLYLPPNFDERRRYPLVIQTHGADAHRFWINGPYTSGFAAQPLAARGIVVLQVGFAPNHSDGGFSNTVAEGPRQMAAYEGAIEALDRRGILDRERIGLFGFSRTVYHVEYTLTHSRDHFCAAAVADGFDGGYVNDLLWGGADYDAVNGGAPLGSHLAEWLKTSPGFNIEHMTTPVHLQFYGPSGVLGAWEWFSILRRSGRPVDFLWLPRGIHVLVRPSDRFTAESAVVDWFCRWLTNKPR